MYVYIHIICIYISLSLSLSLYIYIYTYIHVAYTYIYAYILRRFASPGARGAPLVHADGPRAEAHARQADYKHILKT